MKSIAKVSIIIPCYQCSDTIGRAIESVAAQTILPSEVILIDDHSNDGNKTVHSLEALQSIHPELQITILTLSENKGPASARNLGWQRSTQPYIAFLDADDAWHPQKLEIQYSWMMAHPQATVSAHYSINLSKTSAPKLISNLNAKQVNMGALLRSNFLPCRSVMLKSNIKARFLEGKRQAEDYLLWLGIGFEEGQIWFLNQPLAFSYKSDFGQNGLTADLKASHEGVLETYKLIYQRGLISHFQYCYLLLLAYLKHLRRKMLAA